MAQATCLLKKKTKKKTKLIIHFSTISHLFPSSEPEHLNGLSRHNTRSLNVLMQLETYKNSKEILFWCHYLNNLIFHCRLLQTAQLKTTLEGKQKDFSIPLLG